MLHRSSHRSDSDSIDVEKKDTEAIEVVVGPAHVKAVTDEERAWLASIDTKEQDRIYHKVDRRLVPMLALLYLIAHLDRANIGNAKIEGLETDLNMEGNDYNIALMVFFVPYVLCEVPSNMLLSKFSKPSTYIGILVLCWGLVMTFSGLTKSFAGLCVTRFLIGFFEAGFFPGAMWLVSQWYPPQKTQTRMACFYLSSALSGSFSGLLAAGIAQMDGVGGLKGWRWIFILEGIISVIIGAGCFFLLPDSPSSASWLKPEEARFLDLSHLAYRGVKATHNADGTKKPHVNMSVLKQVACDWQLYLQAMVFWSNVVPNYGLKFTMPSIIKSMGFTSTTAQLLTAPPYFCGAVAAVVSAFFADRISWRMPFIVFHQLLLVIAFAVLMSFAEVIRQNVALCYFMVCLACIGLYPIVPGNNSWTVNNLAGAEKRATGLAFMIAIGNCGGFAGSFIYLPEEAPTYPTGFGSSLGFATAGICAAFLLETLYWMSNKRNEHITEQEAIAKYGEEELERLGDKSPLFKYSY
ncbi:major facilitator superfamily transporter like protein [Zymoseptoria brevis]|uniref:Major facilitator superfamily transporter like protein n=1 Tax=Zymoseptoria brevis TaxID=1047168 RepID=A0A0F4GU27_9PEZI|nr:major facilitator superfamily transporter like protein [Zymoseptoria brevis]